MLSVYPDLNTPSYNQFANTMSLNRPLVQWFVDKFFRSPAGGNSQLISLVAVADLHGIPPTTIIGVEIDPLQTEGMQLRDKYLSTLSGGYP
ncbi:alpha/beta hydrolase fold domain-containing protein [Spirosoma aureum]|uniref:alpha/beta hydrolase fold domain-containing protein n=1 Tax=Spirosoma aureum TaxID=2692134 RepID=UPI00293BA23B|nr:alpha/beta hydrolase fold domain-containing protein [Spirosoma aureum]